MNGGGKILLVDSDSTLQSLLTHNLGQAGFHMVGTSRGAAALPLCRKERPDLVLLEVWLPDGDGLEICRAIRSAEGLSHLPIIILTARASEADRVFGLESGANDYVTKPFSMQELIARIRVHLRSREDDARVLRAGGLELDCAGCRLRAGGTDVSLTEMEFRLLEYFMRKPGIVLSRNHLLNAVWPRARQVSGRTVDVHVARVRRKIEAGAGRGAFIRSVRGFGYSFEPGPAGPNTGAHPFTERF